VPSFTVLVAPSASTPAWSCVVDDPARAEELAQMLRDRTGRDTHVSPLVGALNASSDLSSVVDAAFPAPALASAAPASPADRLSGDHVLTSTKFHLVFAPGGAPDLEAGLRVLHELTDLDWEAVAGTFGSDLRGARGAADVHEFLDEELFPCLAEVGDPDGVFMLYTCTNLPGSAVWTFYSDFGIGDDEAGSLMFALAGALYFDEVRAAVGGDLVVE
jgi:hypothetical protein